MSDFKTQVEDIVGVSLDTSAIADFLTASAREVADILPDRALMLNGLVNEDTVDGNGYTASNQKIFYVSRNGRVSIEVPYGLSTQIAVSSGSIHESTIRTPFHYYKGQYLYIHPAPTSSEKGQVFSFTYPIFASTTEGENVPERLDILDSDIPNFPNNAEFAVVLGGACKYFMKMISDARETIPALLNIDDFNITTTVPSAPTLIDNSIAFTADAPNYISPELTVDISQFETFLETDEDVELAQAQLGRINTELQEYQSNIQDSLNSFNEANVVYQASLQVAIQNAQLSSKDDSEQLNKYAQETSAFSAEINKEVQQYQSNLSQEIQEANANLSNVTSEVSVLNNQYTMCEQKYQNEIARLSGKIGSNKK